MKKIFLFLILVSFSAIKADDCCFGICNDRYPKDKVGESFMFTRPIYRNLAAQQAMNWHAFVYTRSGNYGASFQILPLFQESLTKRGPQKYFLINQKTTLLVTGDDAPNEPNRDVRAEWLGLPSNFSGTLSVNPHQRQYGFWLEYCQNLNKLMAHPFFEPFWISIAMPIQHIENDIRVSQGSITNPSPTPPHDLIEAFNQEAWQFGKLRPTKNGLTAIAEILFKVGTTFMGENGFEIGGYTAFVVPTYTAQKADFIFNPFIGNNRHWGFGTGVHFQFPITCNADSDFLALYFDIENLFFLRNYQRRSLGLRHKPWSRYLLLNKKGDPNVSNIPAINVLTQEVKVQPFNMVDLSAGFRVEKGIFNGEIGYCLWAHGNEELYLKHRGEFPEIFGIAGSAPAISASLSTIEQQADDDLEFVTIKERDLDFCSGAARAAVAHRAHFCLGVTLDNDCSALSTGVGGFVEIPQENTALENWGIWAKLAFTF